MPSELQDPYSFFNRHHSPYPTLSWQRTSHWQSPRSPSAASPRQVYSGPPAAAYSRHRKPSDCWLSPCCSAARLAAIGRCQANCLAWRQHQVACPRATRRSFSFARPSKDRPRRLPCRTYLCRSRSLCRSPYLSVRRHTPSRGHLFDCRPLRVERYSPRELVVSRSLARISVLSDCVAHPGGWGRWREIRDLGR